MIDLAFVRGNLALVEEKLRARGVDPVTALGDFATVDRERREAITQVETLKAQRNKLTEEIAKRKREGADTTALTEQTRTLKTHVESLEAAAANADESPAGTSRPLTSCWMIRAICPTRLATIGNPAAMYSNTLSGEK